MLQTCNSTRSCYSVSSNEADLVHQLVPVTLTQHHRALWYSSLYQYLYLYYTVFIYARLSTDVRI